MNKHRLLKLADYLHSLPKKEFKNFDMEYWYKENCNTVGCAIGHACSISSFKRAGLKLVNLFYDKDSKEHYKEPSYKGSNDFEAVAKFFDIDRDTVDFLFWKYRYSISKGITPKKITPKMVANRIRKVALDNYNL